MKITIKHVNVMYFKFIQHKNANDSKQFSILVFKQYPVTKNRELTVFHPSVSRPSTKNIQNKSCV